ncbi:MAG: MATE family efflux transporter [Treponema sp.]|jgi:putative MATE family efflux protein|nr:MATE family efflux transporter [Treponema sp.]
MTEKWDGRALFRLLWPIIIEQILAVTMGAADTMMVSSVGEFAVSGVNIIDNINNLFIIASTALCTGGAVVVSQYIGRRDSKSAGTASKQLIYIVTLVSLFFLFIAVFLRHGIIRMIYGQIETRVMNAAAVYFFITALSYPFLAIYNADAALFRAAGNSRLPMLIALLVNVVNIGGNAFFIFVLRIGVAGAALSTLLSRVAASFILTFFLVANKRGPLIVSGLHRIRFNRPMIRSILNVGIPSGLESSMFQIGRLLTQRIFSVFGTTAIAANAIASVVNSFSFMPGMAYGMALITIVGQCVGAGDYAAAKKQTARIMKISYLTLVIISVLIYVFMESLISLFNLSPEAHGMAVSFLRIHCISMAIAWPLSFALPNALRAAGDARYVMIVATASMWIVRVSAAYLLTFFFNIGPLGVWLAMGGDFICRGTFYTLRWIGGKWQEKRILEN